MDPATGWHDFFVAEAGASAALAGLVFVAVSINLARILEFPQLPARVLEGLLTLLTVLAVATFALAPGQSAHTLGLEIGLTGLVVWAVKTSAILRGTHPKATGPRIALRILGNQLPPLPFVVAGAMIFAGHPGGIRWTLSGTLLSFAGGLLDAWVLLIEINR